MTIHDRILGAPADGTPNAFNRDIQAFWVDFLLQNFEGSGPATQAAFYDGPLAVVAAMHLWVWKGGGG